MFAQAALINGGKPPYAVIDLSETPTIESVTDFKQLDAITANAYASFDPEFDLLQYYWKLASKPDASKIELNNVDEASIKFQPDSPGIYELELLVFDGFNWSTSGKASYRFLPE